jgi:Tfp pilus assembly protein PilN
VRWWKVLGLAGFAGVAATGVVIARAERQRRAYTLQEITEQLHARLAEAPDTGQRSPKLT